jgi:hypothetical protein
MEESIMMRLYKTTRVLAGLALSLLFLAACTTPTVVIPPTPDLSVVRTEAAQTVVAKVTIAAALNPTATQAPTQEPQVVVITATQAANPTAAPATATSAAVQAPTATTAPTQPPAPSTSSGGGIYPTRTPRTLPDNLSLVSFSPADGASFTPGAEFDAVWTVKNTGTTTWGTDYYVRFKSGVDMGKAVRFYLKEPVAPGETANLIADLVAPPASGTYLSYYEFCTNNADIIYTMYVMITVP